MRVLYLEWMVSGEVIFHSLQTEKKKKSAGLCFSFPLKDCNSCGCGLGLRWKIPDLVPIIRPVNTTAHIKRALITAHRIGVSQAID